MKIIIINYKEEFIMQLHKKILGQGMALFLMAILLVVVTGCNSTDSKNEGATIPKEEPEASTSSWPRSIQNDDGTTVVLEKKPEKIAVLHFGYSEYLLALGITPIATTNKDIAHTFATLQPFQSDFDQMKDLGETSSPSLEKLAELKPDLIIAGSFHSDILEGLRKIAPVIIDKRGNDPTMSWQDTITYYGDILGEEAKAEEYIQKTEQIIQDTNKALAKYSDQTFVFLRPSSKGDFGIVGSKAFGHYHENGFGLKTPEEYPTEWANISLEGLVSLNPDYIFFQDNKEAVDKAIENVKNDTVWQNINAVKNGNIYFLDISLNTGSPLAIELAAKTITESLEQKE